MAIIVSTTSFPFWVLIGLGIDTWLRYRRMRWFWLLPCTILFALFLTCTGGFIFGLTTEDRAGSRYIVAGFAFWSLLTAIFPAIWIRMGIDRRRLRRQSNSLQV